MKKLHSIQVLRALAALVVAMFHVQTSFSEDFGTGGFWQDYLFAFGAVGVHIFFVISGLVMVLTTVNAEYAPGRFIKRRFLRIYPIYWICAAIYFAVYWLLGRPYDLAWPELLGSLLLLPEYSAKIIGPGWTLAYEMYFYLMFAAFMSLTLVGLSFEKALLALAATFFLLIGAGTVFGVEGANLHLITNPLLLEFISGMLIGWLIARGKIPNIGLPAIILALVAYACAIAIGYDVTSRVITMGVGSFLLVLGAVAWERHHGAGKAMQYLSRFGDGSYALYLIHIIVIAIFLRLAIELEVQYTLSPVLMALLLTPLLIWLGQLIHYRMEIPVMLWLKRLLDGGDNIGVDRRAVPPVERGQLPPT